MRRFGDRSTFAVEVGEILPPSLSVVDVWAAGKWLTTGDNVVYVPSFCRYARAAAAKVRQRDIPPCPFPELPPEEIYRQLRADETEFREQYWFLNWNEIFDNLSNYAYLDGDLVIMFAFWRATTHRYPEDLGKVFVARIAPEEFVATLLSAADLLEAEPAV